MSKNEKRMSTDAMNEWGFIGWDTLVALGISATICKFKKSVALCERKEKCFLFPTHHSQAIKAVI